MGVFDSTVSVLDFRQTRYPGRPVTVGMMRFEIDPISTEDMLAGKRPVFPNERQENCAYISLDTPHTTSEVWNPFFNSKRIWGEIGRLSESDGAITRFIRANGFLTNSFRCQEPYIETGTTPAMTIGVLGFFLGERLSEARRQIRFFKLAVALLELYRGGASEHLIVPMLVSGKWKVKTEYSGWIVESDFKGSSPQRAALRMLQRLINSQLRDNASPQLRNDGRAVPQIFLVPHNLAGVGWLQLAQDLSRSGELGRCIECSSWFSRNVRNGKDKVYCSGACRSRAYYRRQRVGLESVTTASLPGGDETT